MDNLSLYKDGFLSLTANKENPDSASIYHYKLDLIRSLEVEIPLEKYGDIGFILMDSDIEIYEDKIFMSHISSNVITAIENDECEFIVVGGANERKIGKNNIKSINSPNSRVDGIHLVQAIRDIVIIGGKTYAEYNYQKKQIIKKYDYMGNQEASFLVHCDGGYMMDMELHRMSKEVYALCHYEKKDKVDIIRMKFN